MTKPLFLSDGKMLKFPMKRRANFLNLREETVSPSPHMANKIVE